MRGRAWPDVASALPYNPVDLRAPTVVFAWDRDAETRARLLAAYPDRTLYVVDGPSRTGGGFAQIEGPVQPGSSLATPPIATP